MCYTKKLIEAKVAWMKDYITNAGCKSWVVGVSGGVDSSVAQRLAEKTGYPVICVAMPMWLHNDSAKGSLDQAMRLCVGRPNVQFNVREIGPIVAACKAGGMGESRLNEGNLRSRIRANILYNFAGGYHGLVIGTGNRDEDEIGYFTKGGDGLVDLCPFSQDHKSQVRLMAAELDVPADIITQNPTAGLWDGQTDEGELGMTYAEVQWAIRYDDLPNAQRPEVEGRAVEVLAKVRHMRKVNGHKLHYPPVFDSLKLDPEYMAIPKFPS